VDITVDEMREINRQRAGQHYPEEAHEAALKINGTTLKPELKASPFIIQFPFCQGNYWTGNHMVLQTVDVIDCLKVIRPDYEVFLFDHSSGHTKKRSGGLDVKDMNVGWGGSAGMNMRSTKIESHNNYLGPFHNPDDPWMVTVGQTLRHIYPKDGEDIGDDYVPPSPINLSPTEREQEKNDTVVEIPIQKRRERAKYKYELITELMDTDTGKQEGRNKLEKMKLSELQGKARAEGISIVITPTTKIKPGWSGRGIGLLAAAYARGWVDKNNIKSYQAMKYDNEGNLVKEFSLQYLLGQCADFQNEVSQLEFVCEQLGATALITPKYHAELAGEGIEYTWGFLKSIYRRYPLEKKKGKTQFEALLNQCLSRDLITKEIVRKFSRRARGYMEAYVALDINEEEEMYGTPIPHRKIEQLKKVLKSHRAAIDFDKEFIMKFVARDGFDIKEVGLDKKPAAVKSEKKKK